MAQIMDAKTGGVSTARALPSAVAPTVRHSTRDGGCGRLAVGMLIGRNA